MTFSGRFKTFAQWARGKSRSTRYFQEITKKHSWAPNLTLKQLRLSPLQALDPIKFSYEALSPVQKSFRNSMASVASEMRHGESLTAAAKNEGLSIRLVKRYLASILSKKNGRYVVQGGDSIERGRWMYSRGERVSITVQNSRDASLISKYLAKVGKALRKNNPLLLKPFEGKSIVDVHGIEYPFETDLKTLRRLQEQVEDPEEVGIYEHSR